MSIQEKIKCLFSLKKDADYNKFYNITVFDQSCVKAWHCSQDNITFFSGKLSSYSASLYIEEQFRQAVKQCMNNKIIHATKQQTSIISSVWKNAVVV